MPYRTVQPCRPHLPNATSGCSAALPALLVAGLLAFPGTAAEAQPAEAAVIEAIEVSVADGRAEVRISSSTELDLVGVRADGDDLLALQLPRHVRGPAVQDIFPEEGLIRSVRATVEDTSRGPLTRVAISVREPVAHDLSTNGSRLRLRVWPEGAESPEAVLRRQVSELETALSNSEATRDDLARRLEAMETRQRELDASLTATLDEVTQALRGLRAETEQLAAQLRQSGSRESALARRVTQLEASLTESEQARARLAARLERETVAAAANATEPAPTVQIGAVSPEGFGGASPPPPAAPAGGTNHSGKAAGGGEHRFIVAASESEELSAIALSIRLRGKGYASEVYWSDSGFYVVTLSGRQTRDEANRLLYQAVRSGDVAADAYPITGTSLKSKIDPQ